MKQPEFLFLAYQDDLPEEIKKNIIIDHKENDKLLLYLTLFQVFLVCTVSAYPYGFYILGLIGGGLTATFAIIGYVYYKGTFVCRSVMGLCQAILLLIFVQQQLGLGESQYQFFIMCMVLTRYKDIAPLLFNFIPAVIHHIVFLACQVNGVEIFGVPILIFNWGTYIPLAYHLSIGSICVLLGIFYLIPSHIQKFYSNELFILEVNKINNALLKNKEELLKNNERHQSFLEATSAVFASLDKSGKFVENQPSWEKFTGQKWEVQKDFGWQDAIHSNDLNSYLAISQKATLNAKPFEARSRVWSAERGEWRLCEIRAVPILGPSNIIKEWVGALNDINEQSRIEEELFKARKLESLGTLAGGIAHDFNNILTGVFGNLQLAKRKLSSDDGAFLNIETADLALDRAKKLAKQFLTFAKGGDPELHSVDLEKVIKESTEFHLSGSNIDRKLHKAGEIWGIKEDEGLISHIIVNLCINAKHAMPQGGTLHIKIENTHTELEAGQEDFVKLMMKDEGIGMTSEQLTKIFDPYYTTKQDGNGLGLTSVYNIIEKHGGKISVESELGKGTTFTLYFPRVKSGEKKITTDSENATINKKIKNARILVMDDEEIIRDLTKSMIDSYGHTSDSAVDGKETMEKFRTAKRSGHPFNVVIMDLTVPGGMGGKETIKELLDFDPAAKVIVSSGYSDDPIVANYCEYGFKGRLNKPFQIEELEAELSRVLSESA